MISLQMLNEEIQPDFYQDKGNIPLAVLLEGEFTSTYNNRILPFKQPDFVPKSQPTKMIVVADGDIAKNQLDNKKLPMELGYDKWTKDRKSTRLNSSHVRISYAVFCLK